MNKTFLSIDIDFWNFYPSHTQSGALWDYLEQAYFYSQKHNIPLKAVMNHQQMLPYVNNSGANVLVNIDSHSDLTSCDIEELNCGTWVAYVNWRRGGKYEWIHMCSAAQGDCNGGGIPIFRNNNKQVVTDVTDWLNVKHKQVKSAPKLDKIINNVNFIAVCSSPDYSDRPLYDVFETWRREFMIDYKKGRKDEYYCRKAKPPKVSPKSLELIEKTWDNIEKILNNY